MSAFRTGVYTVEIGERIGFGTTLNADGSIASVDGPTLRRTVAAPADVDNAGSLALRTNGSLYVTTGAGVWFPIGGAAGWQLPDNATGIWGTAAPGQVTSVYVSAANRWDLSGDAINQATAASGSALRIETGNNTITGAVAGNASGLIEVRTGATDSTNAGGTAGNSGAISLTSGNSTSTLGTSGTTGNISLITGNSDDAASGTIILTTGTAGGARGVIDVNALTVDFATQDTQFLLEDNDGTALSIGAAGALGMLIFDTTNAAEVVIVGAALGARLNDGSPLRFGTPGTDVVFTPDGTDVVVTSTGVIRYVNDVQSVWGTTANDRFSVEYDFGNNQFQLFGTDIVGGGATQATRPILVETGDRTKNDADAGVPTSGAVTIRSGQTIMTTAAAIGGVSGAAIFASGASDVTFAGATGGASGAVTVQSGNTGISAAVAATGGASGAVILQSGDASSVGGGTSGASGVVTVESGTSDDANTGAVALQSGNAAAAGGAIVSGNATVQSGTVGGTGTTGNVSLITGNSAGAGTSGNIVLTIGTAPGGTVGFLDINAATIDTVTQNTQLRLIDASAAALQIGATGALDMLTFDTTNAAEVLIVNAANGLRLNDNVELRFGTPGTDVVFTPDGTDVVVTSTGIIRYNNDVVSGWGTANNDRFTLEYDGGNNRLELFGADITAGGATQPTRAFILETGARTKNDADAGVPTSGAVTILSGATTQTTAAAIGGISGALRFESGATDVTFAGATGGASGTITVQSGNTDISAAVVATGGNSGTVTVQSGNAAITGAAASTGGATGNVTVQSGNATSVGGGTSGASGTLTLRSGTSDDANTGNLTINSGNAAAAGGGILSGNVALSTGTVGGTGTTGTISFTTGGPVGAGVSGPITSTTGNTSGAANTGLISLTTGDTATGTTGAVNLVTGNATGAGTSGNINLTPGTTVGGTRGQTVALGLRTTSATAGAIVGATVLTLADSGGIFSVSQGAAYDIDLPNPTVGAGLRFVFYLTGPAANNVTITVAGAAATFVGTIVNDVTSVIPATGATLTFVTGVAALGDNIEIISISTTLYLVRAVTSANGGITIA